MLALAAGPLVDADGEAAVHLTGLHRHGGHSQGCGTGGARVGHVVDGNARLADLLLQRLADPAGPAHEVSGADHTDVLHGHAAIGERARDRLGREIQGVLVRVLPELGHVNSKNPKVVCHRFPPRVGS